MREICFNTDPLPEAQRIDYWHSMVCSTFVYLELRTAVRSGFHSALRARRCGDLHAVHVRGSAQQVDRSARMIDRDPHENLIVMFQSSGSAEVEQDGRRTGMRPGGCVVLDSRRPYRIGLSEGFEQIVLKVPIAQFRRPGLPISTITSQAVAVDAAAGRLLRATLREIFDEDDAAIGSLGAVAIELLYLVLREPEPLAATGSASLRVLYERALESVRRGMSVPEFGVPEMAREQRISMRQLQKAFAAMGQRPGEVLLEHRLQAARLQLLQSGPDERSVTRIALDCGFTDSGYFSRCFRRRFGCSPTEARSSR